jgi:hypothetical protein
MNFVFPLLILINTDFKRISWVLVMAGVVILAGHYIDFFNICLVQLVTDGLLVPEIASFFSSLVYLYLLCLLH